MTEATRVVTLNTREDWPHLCPGEDCAICRWLDTRRAWDTFASVKNNRFAEPIVIDVEAGGRHPEGRRDDGPLDTARSLTLPTRCCGTARR